MSLSEFTSIAPAVGEVIWVGPMADADAVDAAVAQARAAFPDWGRKIAADRIEYVHRFQNVVRDRADDFAALIANETGKPLWEAKTEVQSVLAKVDISVTAYADRTGSRRTEAGGMRQRLAHKPHGVLAVLGPYNFPAHLPNGHIVPALIAGNTVVFKPSELTPAVGAFMVSCWRAAGLPDGVLTIVQGGADTGRALAGHTDLDGLLFTGSPGTGAALARQFADTPHKILALEMGGNNPLMVWDVHERDIEAAAAIAAQSAWLSAGQRCTCARRLIVEDAHADAFIEALVALRDKLIVGAPFDEPQPFMGPVIDNRAADRLVEGFRGMVDRGGRVIRPLDRPQPGLPFLAPALVDVTDVAARADMEHFGPLLQLIRARDVDAAIAEANNTRYGLSAALVSQDEVLYERFWTEVRAGVVNWNRPTNGAASNAPFGGAGLSGNHRPSAYYAADYCAWPVASMETAKIDAAITTGVRVNEDETDALQ